MVVCLGLALLVAVAPGMTRFAGVWMGRQPDGSFLVSTGQRIEAGSIAFTGRPIDLALHPTKDLFAILNKDSVLLATANGVIKGTEVALGASAGFRGLVWAPDGEWLAASTAFMVISPYNKRKYVDSTFYAQPSMIRSIEMILGLDPMNRFDALADPITTCFTDALDLTPYRAVLSNIPLDERNPAGTAVNRDDRF
jgi:hypothetical protein